MDADVLVIGAGAAGLAAARRIARGGRTPLVVEARERLGGRVHTDRAALRRGGDRRAAEGALAEL